MTGLLPSPSLSREAAPTHRILLVEDDPGSREATRLLLMDSGFDVVTARDGRAALRHLPDGVTVILTDLAMPDMNGLELMRTVRNIAPHTPVIFITGQGNEEVAVEALKSGAFHYLTKPVNPEALLSLVNKACETFTMASELADLHAQLSKRGSFSRMIAKSPAMRRVFEIIRMVANTRSTVLIVGESGTGKELVARALHEHSDRHARPFVAVNCAAVPEALIESEFFGHMKGSFTGASAARSGRFQSAHGGTLLIDEISEMQLDLQSKLLRAIETLRVNPVGSDSEVEVDVRIIASSNRDLKKQVELGAFREDLYYRLNVVRIDLPPLRERRSDIPLLIRAFMDEFSRENHRPEKGITTQALAHLQGYDWPGNVRELHNVIECMMVMSTRDEIDVPDLPPTVRGSAPEMSLNSLAQQNLTMEEIERQAIAQTLHRAQGSRTQASRILGISVRTLQRKIKRYDLEP